MNNLQGQNDTFEPFVIQFWGQKDTFELFWGQKDEKKDTFESFWGQKDTFETMVVTKRMRRKMHLNHL